MSALADHIQMPGTAARLRWTLSDALALARRNLEHVRQIPEKLIDVTVQPLMFVLLFAYVFGGVVDMPGRLVPRVSARAASWSSRSPSAWWARPRRSPRT